jgi:hypothetical protein
VRPKGGEARRRGLPSERACGARPSEGWAIQARTALRGKPGDGAEGGFLGGTHSPRPGGRALRMPRHNIHGGKRTPGGQRGHAPARPIPSERACGARPSAGGPSKLERPCGESPEMTRKAIFSEGRTPCVRMAEPHGWEGTSLPPVVRREAGGLMGVQEEGARPPQRACGARPSAGGTVQGKVALRGNPGDEAKGGFPGGTRSPRPRGRALRTPRHSIPAGWGARGGWPKGGNMRVGAMPPLRACGARPSAARPVAMRIALRGKPGDGAEGDFLGGTHSVRPDCRASRMGGNFITAGG